MQNLTPVSFSTDALGADLLPVEELADCVQTALARDGKTVLSYGAGAGYTPLRELVGQWFGVHPSRVLLTNGQLDGLALLARHIMPGRSAIAEYPIYDRAQNVILRAGGSLIGTPVAEDGLVTDELQHTLGMNMRPAMVYVIPSFHNPTGWTTPVSGRKRIVDLVLAQNRLQTEQILLFEDDSYGLTRFEGEAPPALFDISAGQSVYSSSLSTMIAPGLRVGFLVLPEELAVVLSDLAADTYITPALLAQATVFEFISRGSFESHLARLREELKARRDAMLAGIEKHFPDATWSRPEGGFFVWLQLPGYPDGREVLKRAVGVTACDGTQFGAMSSELRLSFAAATPDDIEAGVERLAAALYDVMA